MATRRTGKPYVYVTWLAKILGGQQCVWKAWFAAHYRYDKFEEMAGDLVQWNREHNELMRARVRELQREGFTVTTEEQNAFKLEGECAVVAGKPDIVATKPGIVLVVDGKTGRQRESDLWQLIFYLFAWPKCRSVTGELEGEVQYKRGNERISLTVGMFGVQHRTDGLPATGARRAARCGRRVLTSGGGAAPAREQVRMTRPG